MIKTTALHVHHAFFLNLNKIHNNQLQEKSPAFDILGGSK